MSGVLFGSPYIPPHSGTQATSGVQSQLALGGPLSVAPTGGAQGASLGSDPRSGSGAGSNQKMTIFQFKSRDAVPSVPVPDADSGSIVNAQVQDPRPPRMEAAARAPNTAFRAETDEDALPVKVGPDLPEVEMPDPLPTSPFLKRV